MVFLSLLLPPRRFVRCLLVVLVGLSAGAAKKPRWRSTNPGGGGAFNSPVITPQGFYVVGSDLGGVYVSRNRGASWTAIGSTSGLETTHISSLAAHPVSGRWMIGTEDGIYLSRNAKGKKIRKVHDGNYISAIGVGVGDDFADFDVVYAVEHAGYDTTDPTVIWRSTDGGQSWQARQARGLQRNGRIVALRLHPVDPDAVWVITGRGRAAGSDGRAYLSTDGGQSFVRRDPQDGNVVDLAFAMDASNLNRVWLTVLVGDNENGEGAFYESEDAGFSWKKVVPDDGVRGGRTGVILANAKNNPNHVRLIDFNYRSQTSETILWETSNGGKTWTRRSNEVQGGWSTADERWGMGDSFQGSLQTIGYVPTEPQVALWVNTQFVYHTTDGGQTWVDACSNEGWISRGIDNVVPVVLEPTPHAVLYAGYADVGLWKSDNQGQSWQSLNMDLDTWTNAGLDPDQWWDSWGNAGGNTHTIATDPERPNVLWASVGEHQYALVKSTNQGRSFSRITRGLPKDLIQLDSLSVAADSFVDARWIFVVANGNVYLNEDDGNDEWTMVLDCQGVCQGVKYTDGGGVYAYGPSRNHNGLWHSWQGGVAGSWTVVESIPNSVRDGGWTPGLHWIDDHWSYRGPMDLATRDNGRQVWLVIRGKGVYYSNNYNNGNWKLILPHEYARSIAVASKTSQEVFVATSTAFYAGGYQANVKQGLWIHRKGGTKSKGWKLFSTKGLAWPFATKVVVTEAGGTDHLWMISPGQGILQWN